MMACMTFMTFISYLISLNPMLFKNIAHVGSFKHFVFVYLCILKKAHMTFLFTKAQNHKTKKAEHQTLILTKTSNY